MEVGFDRRGEDGVSEVLVVELRKKSMILDILFVFRVVLRVEWVCEGISFFFFYDCWLYCVNGVMKEVYV